MSRLCFVFLFLFAACSHKPALQNMHVLPTDDCAYSNFLKGHKAEMTEDYASALSYYQKAHRCDNNSKYLQNKIPLTMMKMEDFTGARLWLEKHINNYKEDKELALLLAHLYGEEGDEQRAIDLYNNMLKEIDDPDVSLQLAHLYHSLGLYQNAQNILKVLVQQTPQSYPVHLLLARTYGVDNQLENAKTHYDKALSIAWSSTLAYEMAAFLSDIGNHAKSLELYDKILKIQQDDELAFSLKLGEMIHLGQIKDALQELDDHRDYTQNPEYLDNIVVQYFMKADYQDEATALLRAMTGRYHNGYAAYSLALIYYEKKAFEESLHWLEQVPDNDEMHEIKYALQVDVLLKQNKSQEAIVLLENAISRYGLAEDYKLLAFLYQLHQNDLRKAEQEYKKGLENNPAHPDLSYAYALLLDKEMRHNEAIAIMEEVLEEDPNNAEALNFIGYTWANNNENLQKALEYTKRAAEIMPDNGYIRDSVGWCYYKLGLYEEAIFHLQRAYALEPRDASIIEHLGDVYVTQSLFEEARTYYTKALNMLLKLKNIQGAEKVQKKLYNLHSLSQKNA